MICKIDDKEFTKMVLIYLKSTMAILYQLLTCPKLGLLHSLPLKKIRPRILSDLVTSMLAKVVTDNQPKSFENSHKFLYSRFPFEIIYLRIIRLQINTS